MSPVINIACFLVHIVFVFKDWFNFSVVYVVIDRLFQCLIIKLNNAFRKKT